MIAGAVARRYAQALIELGAESGQLDALVEEISAIAASYESSPELQDSLENPLFPHAVKKNILSDLAQTIGLGQTTRNALFLLNDRRRMRVLPGIARLMREMNDKKKGLLRAEVVTATALSEAYYGRLQQQLEKMTGKKVVLDKREDPTILAGVITRIGDTVYDGSLRSRLHEIKHALLPSA
ncbi:MAG TPA: ATP synthase F1 subunit delta [Polyangiaceae bacterium]|jgi:F-type H+-transporting ATPase subunit delta